jgi:ornithine carbamoyltransferase
VTGPRHFLDLRDFESATLRQMLDVAAHYKKARGVSSRPLAGKTLALIFEKPSTRTRVSFEVGMRQLGGEVIFLSAADMQTSRGESPADTARVLSRYVDAIVMRTSNVAKIRELAQYATVPVINGLTDLSHPCQLMADVLTFEEHRGSWWHGAATATTLLAAGSRLRCGSVSRSGSPPPMPCVHQPT